MDPTKRRVTISILGSGWLGAPLARHFAGKGFRVNISTTRPEKVERLRGASVAPFCFDLNDPGAPPPSFLDADILVVAVTAKNISAFRRLLDAAEASSLGHILYTGSTSVYPAGNRTVTEDDALTHSVAAEIESLFSARPSDTVLRLAGLIGCERHPGRFFQNGKMLKDPGSPVNLIHRDDCIGIIDAIIAQRAWGEVFNGCADTHPAKGAYYARAAQLIGLPPPVVDESAGRSAYRIVGNDKVKEKLGYRFVFPDISAALTVPGAFSVASVSDCTSP